MIDPKTSLSSSFRRRVLLAALLVVGVLAGGVASRASTPFSTLLSSGPPAPERSPAAGAPGADAAPVRSRRWDDVEAADALIRDGAWRKAAKLIQQTLDRTLHTGWQEPDLNRVLAAQSLQRAILALHRRETGEALWLWDEARNLDPAADARLEAFGDLAPELVEPLRDHVSRRLGHFRDGTTPPPRFATPGFQSMEVGEVPPVGFGTAWARQLGHLPQVTVEVVVGADGAFHDPVVTREGFPPVLLYWTLEQIRTADVKIRPARLDGKPIDDLTTIEMDFKTPSRW